VSSSTNNSVEKRVAISRHAQLGLADGGDDGARIRTRPITAALGVSFALAAPIVSVISASSTSWRTARMISFKPSGLPLNKSLATAREGVICRLVMAGSLPVLEAFEHRQPAMTA
jgi:hypothetical protein